MNNKKVKALKLIYDERPMLSGRMTFRQYKKIYLKDVTRGSEAIRIINARK